MSLAFSARGATSRVQGPSIHPSLSPARSCFSLGALLSLIEPGLIRHGCGRKCPFRSRTHQKSEKTRANEPTPHPSPARDARADDTGSPLSSHLSPALALSSPPSIRREGRESSRAGYTRPVRRWRRRLSRGGEETKGMKVDLPPEVHERIQRRIVKATSSVQR